MEILFHGVATKTNGTPVKVGEKLPAFTVKDAADTVKTGTQLFTKVSLISVVPDIDTRVCSLSTKRFNQEVDNYNNINFYTISTNTLERQKNWCAAEGVAKLELLSDATAEFGKAMGLYVEEKGIDARSIWIVDTEGKVLYQELLTEQSDEPNYAKALEFLDSLDQC